MAHGPDTEELLRGIEEARTTTKLSIGHLNISSLPPLPAELKELYCFNTPITTLPPLPVGLEVLDCWDTPLTSLPELPGGLQVLSCWHTRLTSLPELPAGLRTLYCFHTPLILQRTKNESIGDYNLRWREWREEQTSKKRTMERCKILKQDLMAECYKPERVEHWLESGGDDLVDMMFG